MNVDYCPHGHALTEDNIKLDVSRGKPYRRCLTCRRAWKDAHKAATRPSAATTIAQAPEVALPPIPPIEATTERAWIPRQWLADLTDPLAPAAEGTEPTMADAYETIRVEADERVAKLVRDMAHHEAVTLTEAGRAPIGLGIAEIAETLQRHMLRLIPEFVTRDPLPTSSGLDPAIHEACMRATLGLTPKPPPPPATIRRAPVDPATGRRLTVREWQKLERQQGKQSRRDQRQARK